MNPINEQMLTQIQLQDYLVGDKYTTMLVEYGVCNIFAYFSENNTCKSFGFLQLRNENLNIDENTTQDIVEKKLMDFIANKDIEDLKNKIKTASFETYNSVDLAHGYLSFMYNTKDILLQRKVEEKILILSSRKELIEETLLSQLKALLPRLNKRAFADMNVGLHKIPGERVQAKIAVEHNQKIFAPYYFITMQATADFENNYHELNFEKGIFLNFFKAFNQKTKCKYQMSEFFRAYSFLDHNNVLENFSSYLNNCSLDTHFYKHSIYKKNGESFPQNIYNYLNNVWQQKTQSMAFKEYEKNQIQKSLSLEIQELPIDTGSEKRKSLKI